MEKLKVGIIGAGGISHEHLPHLKNRNDAVELAAIADVNGELAAKAAEQYGIAQTFTDWRELLPIVDAVLVCVPTFLHAEIVSECLRAGKAVFCEKPLTRTLEQAETIRSAVEESGSPFQVGFVRRFEDGWMAWRKAILDEKIGRPIVWRDVASYSGPAPAWFNQDELGGGPFLDGCIHNIDFALYTFGPAKWAFCNGRTLRDTNTAIDTGSATVRFQSGDEMLLAWSWGLPVGTSGGRIFEFLGPKGTIVQSEVQTETELNFLVSRSADEADQELLPYPPNSIAIPTAFARQMDEFIEVARGNAKPRAGFEEGLASLRLALAILESARTEQLVTL